MADFYRVELTCLYTYAESVWKWQIFAVGGENNGERLDQGFEAWKWAAKRAVKRSAKRLKAEKKQKIRDGESPDTYYIHP